MERLIPVRYTVRREKSGPYKGQDSLILLDESASYGRVAVWDDVSGHAEGERGWYSQRTKKTPMSDAQALAEKYFRAYYSPAEREIYRMVYCHRIPEKAWTKGER